MSVIVPSREAYRKLKGVSAITTSGVCAFCSGRCSSCGKCLDMSQD